MIHHPAHASDLFINLEMTLVHFP